VQDEVKQGPAKSNRPANPEFDALPQRTDQLAIVHRKIASSWSMSLDPRDVLALQHAYGNRAVQRLITRQTGPRSDAPFIQATLTVGPADDPYEREADRVAAQVVSQINAPQSPATDSSNSVQRRQNPEEDKESTRTALAEPIRRQGSAEEGEELKRK